MYMQETVLLSYCIIPIPWHVLFYTMHVILLWPGVPVLCDCPDLPRRSPAALQVPTNWFNIKSRWCPTFWKGEHYKSKHKHLRDCIARHGPLHNKWAMSKHNSTSANSQTQREHQNVGTRGQCWPNTCAALATMGGFALFVSVLLHLLHRWKELNECTQHLVAAVQNGSTFPTVTKDKRLG